MGTQSDDLLMEVFMEGAARTARPLRAVATDSHGDICEVCTAGGQTGAGQCRHERALGRCGCSVASVHTCPPSPIPER